MSRRRKIITIIGVSFAALVVMLIVAAMIAIRTQWFRDYVREKIVAETEDATGGKVDLGAFQFDANHFRASITNFAIHGTEPAGSAPLFHANEIELRLKILAGLRHAIDLEYLGVDQPSANIIVYPDGRTNIPAPKAKSSNTNGLQTVVDLAIHRFEIKNGSLEFLQQKTGFSGKGQDLRAQLFYNPATPGYQGDVSLNLDVASPGRQPLKAQVKIPVAIGRDSVQVKSAKITTPQSEVDLDGGFEHVNAPVVSAHLNAKLSLAEIQRSVDIPIYPNAKGVPTTADADIVARVDEKSVQVTTARVTLGHTQLEASGNLKDASGNGSLVFNADLALGEIGRLLKLSAQPEGTVQIGGTAQLDANSNYRLSADVKGHNVSLQQGTTHLKDLQLSSAVTLDQHNLALKDLKLRAMGGEITGDAELRDFAQLKLDGNLRNFNLRDLTAQLSKKPLNYGGVISGTLRASGNIKVPEGKGIDGQARLVVTPTRSGVPVSGNINVDYSGKAGTLALDSSGLKLPNTRIDLRGMLGQEMTIRLSSSNLDDLLPVAQATSQTPPKHFPITLNDGTAALTAQVTGPLTAPRVGGHLEMTRFSVQERPFDRLAADLTAAPSGVNVQNGTLSRQSLQAQFSASVGMSHWSAGEKEPLAVNATIRNADMADILAFAGQSSIRMTGAMNADAKISGTLGNPQGSVNALVLNGTAYDEKFDRLQLAANFTDQLVTLTSAMTAGPSRLDLQGSFNHPRDSFERGHIQAHLVSNDISLAQLPDLEKQHPGLSGTVTANVDLVGDLRTEGGSTEFVPTSINGRAVANNVQDKQQKYGNLTATAQTSGSQVKYRVDSDFSGSSIQVNGETTLAKDYPTEADINIKNLQIEKVLSLAGRTDIQASGTLATTAHANGTWKDPRANGSLTVTKAVLYDEPIDQLQATVNYAGNQVDIKSLQVSSPAGKVEASGSFTHAPNDFETGDVQVHITSSAVQLAKVQNIQKQKPGLGGTVHLAADGSAKVRKEKNQPQILLSKLDAKASATGLEYNKQSFGDATLQADTSGSTLTFKLDSNFAKSSIHGNGQAQLRDDYPVKAHLTFANVTYSGLQPFLNSASGVRPGVEGLAEGEANIDGPAMQPENMRGDVRLTRLELSTTPRATSTSGKKTIQLRNDGPIEATLDRKTITIRKAHVLDHSTDITLAGSVSLQNERPLNLTVNATSNLEILQDFDRDLYSGGNVTAQAAIHGSFDQPLVNGKVELKNASLNLADVPNGISNANGVILLNGNNATIQNLTAESGGGKITLTGFGGFAGSTLSYNVRADANRVRTRTEGASILSSGSVRLTGNTEHSMLSGDVTIQRVAFNSQSDLGSILSRSSMPPKVPTAPSGPLEGMRLDLHVKTSPNLAVETAVAQRVQVEADISIRGTMANPGAVGRASITQGKLIFFSNEYTVNRGVIAFYNPVKIAPILNLDLETNVQGMDVVISLSGPIDDMKLAYRSNPPLQFQDIVALLATGKTPPDPVIAAHQPTPPQQSLTQRGESAVVSQAVAKPVASRLEHVFGINQLKIDPTFTSGSTLPQARVTLQQQVTGNLTFSYTTDLASSNTQIIRVELALSPRFSAVATRDENGIFGIDFFYKKRFR